MWQRCYCYEGYGRFTDLFADTNPKADCSERVCASGAYRPSLLISTVRALSFLLVARGGVARRAGRYVCRSPLRRTTASCAAHREMRRFASSLSVVAARVRNSVSPAWRVSTIQ